MMADKTGKRLLEASWKCTLGTIGLVALTGCSSLSEDSGALQALAEFAAKKAVVEGLIEFSGPEAQWSGPSSFKLHVIAKEGERPEVRVTPDLGWDSRKGSDVVWLAGPVRSVASTGTGDSAPASGSPARVDASYSIDLAREQLSQLASEIEGTDSDSDDAAFTQCLYPVRVRLTRTDGTQVERSGCRGLGSWEQKASEYSSQVLSLVAVARTAPASLPPAAPQKAIKDPAGGTLAVPAESRTPASDSDSGSQGTH